MGVRLPAEYRRVEYLQNSSDGYIVTEYVPPLSEDIMVTFDYELTQTTSGDSCVFGYLSGASKDVKLFADLYRGTRWFCASGLYQYSAGTNMANTLNYKYHAEMTSNAFSAGDRVATLTTALTTGSAAPIYIFGRNRNDEINALMPGVKLYSLTFLDGDVLSADFIPCVRISDGEPGMYETVSGKFYTNAGSGEFIAGPDVIATEVSEWLMARRRGMMRGAGGGANGWNKAVYTATDDTLKGNRTTSAIKKVIPSNYRYAVAISDEISSHEENEFIACVFIPNVSYVLGFRWNSGDHSVTANISSSSADVILRAGNSVTVWYRTEPLENDTPASDWNYYCLKPGATAKANELSAAFASVGTYSAMLSVLDWDYSTPPDVDGAFVASVTKNNGSYSGSFVRHINGRYGTGAGWIASAALATDSTAKIACFYI